MFAMTKAAEDRSPDNNPEQTPGTAQENTNEVPSDSMEAENQASTVSSTDWTDLVSRIRSGDDNGMEELYRIFSRGIRYYLCRQLGPQELDDKVHDSFLIVVQAIKRGDLREPDRLMGFIRTVVRRQVAAHIDEVVHSRREEVDMEVGSRIADRRGNPEQNLANRQKAELMRSEILTRFYLQEQPQEQICQEMKLTETQFRLLKSRAKDRFGELGKKKLQRSLLSYIVRIS
jgi:DNA-directed RNA polymerase specialized sigma24 family protein